METSNSKCWKFAAIEFDWGFRLLWTAESFVENVLSIRRRLFFHFASPVLRIKRAAREPELREVAREKSLAKKLPELVV